MPAEAPVAAAVLDSYRSLLGLMDAAARAASPPDSPSPCGGCHACCGPLSLLPIEAHALLAAGLPDGRAPAAAACPLLDQGGCRAGTARPFACRTRGLAVRHLDVEGVWTTAACGFIGSDGGDAVVPLEEWVALLFRLDRQFRACLGLRAGRIDLVDLCRTPGRYRALLSVAAARPLVSRAAP